MSEFSKEYLIKEGINSIADFSFKEEFKNLNDGESIPLICEGFGTKAIAKQNGINYILLADGTETTLHLLLSNN